MWGSETPEPIELKFGMIDYIRHRTPHPNFGGDRLSGGKGQIPYLYHYLLSFFTSYYFDSISKPTADTAELILTHNSSYAMSP